MAKKTEEELDAELDAAAEEAEGELDGSDQLRDGDVDKSDERAPQRIRRRPGRPRKHPLPVERERERLPFTSISAHLSEGDDPRAKLFATKDLATIWNMVVDQAREQQMPPEAIGISCKKMGLGAFPTGEQDLATINGETVMGDEHTSPGECLVHYLTQIHLQTSKGPKLFKCRFWYRTGTRNRIAAPEGELRLGAPEEVQAEINAKAAFLQQKAIDDAVKAGKPLGATGYRPPMPPQYPGYPQAQPGYPSWQPMPAMPGYYPPPPIQGASPELEAMRREMATMMGAINERARLEGLTPPAPAATGPSAEEQAAVIARTVAQTLVGLGFTPDLAKKLNSPTMTAQSVQAAITDPMDLMDQMFDRMDRYDKMRAKIQERFTPEEEEPKTLAVVETKVEIDKTVLRPIPLAGAMFGGKPVNYGDKGEDEGVINYVVRLAMGNPDLAMAFVEKLSNSALAQALPTLIQRLIAAGLPGVASAMQAKQIAATSAASANGSANGVVVNAPQPAPSQPAASWGMPKV